MGTVAGYQVMYGRDLARGTDEWHARGVAGARVGSVCTIRGQLVVNVYAPEYTRLPIMLLRCAVATVMEL